MTSLPQTSKVPKLASCDSFAEVLEFMTTARSESAYVWTNSAQYAMALVARSAVGASSYFDDACFVVDQLANAKAQIDIMCKHVPYVTRETQSILGAAQEFLDAQTIGCTEWPTPSEVAAEVERVVSHRASE